MAAIASRDTSGQAISLLLLPIQLDGQDPTCWNQLTQSSM